MFGMTIGANIEDPWTPDMLADFARQCEVLGVDPRSDNFVYLLHHNQGTPGILPYFPESQSYSMTFLTRHLIETFGALSPRKLSRKQMSQLKVPDNYRVEVLRNRHVSSLVVHVYGVKSDGTLEIDMINSKRIKEKISYDKILTIRPARLKGNR